MPVKIRAKAVDTVGVDTDGIPEGDPFADVALDEYFIAAASTKELSAAQRLRKPAHPPALDQVRGPFDGAPARRRSGHRDGMSLRLVIGGILAAVVLMLLAGPGTRTWAAWALGTPLPWQVVDDMRPTPQRAASRSPLGAPQTAPAGGGPYRFLALQPDSTTPVSYDPCRPLPYVVNGRTAPPGSELLVENAIRRIEQVTGLQFTSEGMTSEPASEHRNPFQKERYGDRWAPILIAWSDPTEVPRLAGDVAGTGGSTLIGTPGGPDVFVTGLVTLDGPQLTTLMSQGRREQVQAVIVHELAHVVGLDHVEDLGQLMHPRSHHTDVQQGDIAGLAQLGAGPCVRFL